MMTFHLLRFAFFNTCWKPTRVLHTAHHRAQLGVYLRVLNKTVPTVYGPTVDVRWEGADPTSSVAAASRK